jgi:hypothetical protein
MSDFDKNVSSYSLSELLTITGIEDTNINEKTILSNTNKLIYRFKEKDPEISLFFQKVQSQLLHYAKGLAVPSYRYTKEDPGDKIIVEGFKTEAIYPDGEKQIKSWMDNEYLTQKNKNQVDKITQRKML